MTKQANKSILDEAYDEARALEEALKSNAKDLLSATMKTDLDELIKESLEEDNDEEEVEVDVETDDDADVDVEVEDEDEPSEEESEISIDNLDELPGEEETETDIDIEEPATDLEPIETGSDVVDMTSASDEDVLKVFKKMGPEDGIVVTRDVDGNIDVNTGTEEFKIITTEEPGVGIGNEGINDLGAEDELEEGEVIYELDLDEMGLDEDMYEDKNSPFDGKGGKTQKNAPYTGKNSVSKFAPYDQKNKVQAVSEVDDLESEMKENKPRVMSNRYRTTGNNQNAGSYTNGQRQTRGALQQEVTRHQKLVESLKAENQSFKKAVEDFKNKLHEVAVFNSNLAYSVRLFTENSTTKKEKINILRRFDNVKTLEESKNLFDSVRKELLSENVIKESKSIDEKITKTPQTSVSNQTEKQKTHLVESKIYEDPKFKRSLDIMKKINL